LINRGQVVRNRPFAVLKVKVAKKGLPYKQRPLLRKAVSNSKFMAIGVDLVIVEARLELRKPAMEWMHSVRSTIAAITTRVMVNVHATKLWLVE